MSFREPSMNDIATYITAPNVMQVKDATIEFTLKNSNLSCGQRVFSPMCPVSIYGWYFEVHREKADGAEDELSIFLHCKPMSKPSENSPKNKQWYCEVEVDLKIVNQIDKTKSFSRSLQRTYNASVSNWGFAKCMKWSKFTSYSEGFRKGDTVVFQAVFKNISPFFSNS